MGLGVWIVELAILLLISQVSRAADIMWDGIEWKGESIIGWKLPPQPNCHP